MKITPYKLKDKETGQIITNKMKYANVAFEWRMNGTLKAWKMLAGITNNERIKKSLQAAI